MASLIAFPLYYVKAFLTDLFCGFYSRGYSPNKVEEKDTHAPVSLDVIVIGGGIGGLAAAYQLGRSGHKVTVLEAASLLGEVGAGIQLTPNVTKLLIRWGLGAKLKDVSVVPQVLSLRRYENGELVGWNSWGDNMEKDHGSPYYHIHRADLHRMLLELASPFITVRPNSKVTVVDPFGPTVTLESGEILKADLVIGSDGVKSRVRDVVVGVPDRPKPTGDAAYRAVIPTAEMEKDPELKPLVDEGGVTVWMGPGRHLVGYCVRAKKDYNIVMLHPAREDDENMREGDCEVMRSDYVGFEPRIQRLLKLVPSTMIWSLMDRSALDAWVHESGKVTLLGDACHPMLPYRAQGAAMAVEDAAVLGNLFSRVSDRSQVPILLKAYEELRKPRATDAQTASRMNQKIFHFADGPEQEARDASMRSAMEAALKEAKGEDAQECAGSANLWADKARSKAAFGYDADGEVDKWWEENGAKIAECDILVKPSL